MSAHGYLPKQTITPTEDQETIDRILTHLRRKEQELPTRPPVHVNGKMVPLPEDMCSYESKLRISFGKRDEVSDVPMVPVMWQCGKEIGSVAKCVQECGGCC